jgi:hypothetical protein
MTLKSMSIQITLNCDTEAERDLIVNRLVEAAEQSNSEADVNCAAIVDGYAAIVTMYPSQEFLIDFLTTVFDAPVETLRGEKDEIPDPDWEQRDGNSWDRLVD